MTNEKNIGLKSVLMKIRTYIDEGAEARKLLNADELYVVGEKLYGAIATGHKLVTFGNGGSAADAQHMAAELSGRFMNKRKSLPAIALTTNTSTLTAIGNDYSYEEVFSRQVQGLVQKGDFVVGISTSGNSKNVIRGINEARKLGAYTVALTGRSGGKLINIAEKTITVDSDKTPIIQEVHIAIIHTLCMILDELLKLPRVLRT